MLAWANVFRIMRDKSVRGTHWQSMIFWSVWGWWNIAYYATIGHWLSLTATSGLVLANCVWVVLAYKYSQRA